MYYNDDLYVLRGTNTTTLYKYSLTTSSWSTLAVAPGSINDDIKGVLANGNLYFFRGGNTNTFYRYSPAQNTWATLSNTPAPVRYGAALAYPGTGDYLYATRGSTTNTVWRYSISGNSWDDPGVTDLPVDAESSNGSRLVADSSTLYYIPGVGISRLLSYDIASDTWSEKTSPPFAPYNGTDIVYANGRILALAGWYKNDFWEYSIADDDWRKLPSIAGYLPQDLGPYSGASIEYDGNSTFYITRGNSRLNLLSYTPGSSDYLSTGTWVSEPRNLGYVTAWNSLTASTVTPDDSSVVFQTRTSSDASNWSNWAAVSGSSIASPPNTYLQIKAVLIANTAGTDTPILHDITVSYSGDSTPPTNPTGVTGSSQEIGGVALTSESSYAYNTPFFSWTGAADAETAVDGYYVYFGTNPLADPEAVGVFQVETTYTVTKPLSTGTYYLLLKTKDTAGNISATESLFVYDYQGVSPPQSLLVSQTSEFTGVAENLSLTNDSISLANRAGGFWMQETLTTPPGSLQYGAKTVAYDEAEQKLYVLRGNNSAVFYSYDIQTDVWTTLANAPANVRMGGGVIEGPTGYLYGLRGNNTTSFWRYDIANNTWSDEDAADTPLTVYYGGSMVFDGEAHIYTLRGNNDDAFWRYDVISDSWESLANTDFGATANAVNNNAYISADLAIDRANDKVYAIQGNYLDGFSVYDSNTNTWEVLPDLPGLPYQGASIEYVANENAVYYTLGNSSNKMFKFDVASEEWSAVAPSPTFFNYGGNIRNVGSYLYAIQGNNSTGFFKYNVSNDSWMTANRGLFGRDYLGTSYLNQGAGADIVQGDGNNLYITRGNYSNDFVRWNSETGITTKMANLPSGAFNGSSLVYDSSENKIYFTGGSYLQKFFVYDVPSNSWSEVASDPYPANVDVGSSMVYDGSQYIYLTRGAGSTSLYRYDTQGSAGSRWSTLANTPATLSSGSELTLDGGYLYVLRGQNVANNPFFRYEIATDTWSDPAVADLSIDVNNDGFLTNGGNGYLYAARGENDTDFFSYSLAGNTWTTLANTPARISTGGSGESNGINKLFMLPGTGTGSAQDGVYTYIQESADSAFVTEGTYTTPVHDLSSVYKWANVTLTYESAKNTSLRVESRSSQDNSTWSPWTAVAEARIQDTNYTYQIKSPPARYIQLRFTLASADGVLSGRIQDYSIYYYRDSTAPSNPVTDGFSAYSSNEPGSALVTNTWYGYSQPYFDWPEPETEFGASDSTAGSGVSGYYVYFGTDQTADPVVAGTLQLNSHYTASSLLNGQTYYLRIRATDDAGNIAAETWQPFIYKFDNEAPTAPADVSADPSGYSASNSFDFSWSVASSSAAPITGYCYKTGATSGDFASDQCGTETTISAVPAYKIGTNTFYVRTQDSAGNYSAYVSIPYYYVDSDNAPAPPTNLSVTPASNTENSFAFSWSPPAAGTFYGSQANLSYHYSINALPSASTTNTTSLTSLLPGAFATVPGDNVFYIVTKDEAGNINYRNYAQVTFSANTSAPGIPLNIDIADVSVKSTSSWKLALSWESPSDSESGVSTYDVYRSTDGETFSKIASSGGISFVDTRLTQQTYYYKVRACDSTNNCGAFSEVVSLFPDGKYTTAAELVANPTVSDVTTQKATISWTTSRTADSRIAYGLGSGEYFDAEVSNSEQVTNHILKLSNLSPGTTYYYVTRWSDEDGNLGVSEEASFTTAPPPSTAEPTVKTVSLDSALLQFTSINAARVRVYFGETSAFGGTVDVVTGSGEGTHTVQLTDLSDGTKYFYKINSFDSEGQEYEGEIHSFTTLPRPKISNITINQVKGTAQSTLLLSWQTNTEVSSIVTYYPIVAPSAALDEINIALKAGQHQMVLTGLQPQTTYQLIIKGKDVAGNEAVGELQQVTTSADSRPPQISDLSVESEILGTGDEATAQLIVSFKTDEASTSQIEFGEGTGSTYSQKTQEDATLTNNHLVVISELSPAKVYHLRAVSKDQFGNQAESIDKVVITPKATDNALDLVITNMSSIFGFLAQ